MIDFVYSVGEKCLLWEQKGYLQFVFLEFDWKGSDWEAIEKQTQKKGQ